MPRPEHLSSFENQEQPRSIAEWSKVITDINRWNTETRGKMRGRGWRPGKDYLDEIGYLTIEDDLVKYSKHFTERLGPELELERRIFLHIKHKGKIALLDVGCGSNSFNRDVAESFLGQVEAEGISLSDQRTWQEKRTDKNLGIQFHDADLNTWRPKNHRQFDIIVAKESLIHVLDPLRSLAFYFSLLPVGGEMYVSLSEEGLAEAFSDLNWDDINEAAFRTAFRKAREKAFADARAFIEEAFNVSYSLKAQEKGYVATWKHDVLHIIRLDPQAQLAFPGVTYNPDHESRNRASLARAQKERNPAKKNTILTQSHAMEGVYTYTPAK